MAQMLLLQTLLMFNQNSLFMTGITEPMRHPQTQYHIYLWSVSKNSNLLFAVKQIFGPVLIPNERQQPLVEPAIMTWPKEDLKWHGAKNERECMWDRGEKNGPNKTRTSKVTALAKQLFRDTHRCKPRNPESFKVLINWRQTSGATVIYMVEAIDNTPNHINPMISWYMLICWWHNCLY